MRVEVKVRYVQGTVELYNEEGVIQRITPNEIFSVGNSIGGFWGKPIEINKEPRIQLINVSGTQKSWDINTLENRLKDAKGIILFPGDIGFWALSSGAARNGIFHRKRTENDPLKKFFREELHISTKTIEYVDSIDKLVELGGNLCSHRSSGMNYTFITDGMSSLKYESSYAPDTHSNQYHRGCQTSPEVYQVTGGSYLVTFSQDEFTGYKIQNIFLTATADKKRVIEYIKNFYKN